MHNACAKQDHAEDGWLLHFYTGLLLGLIAVVVTAFLHELPAVSALAHLGDNIAQQVYAEGQPLQAGAPKLVLLDLDFSRSDPPGSSDVARISRAIRLLALSRPKMLLIDQEIQATSKPEIADEFVAAVQAVAPIPVVLAAAQLSTSHNAEEAVAAPGPVDALRAAPNVRFASPTLLRDADGLIRSVPRTVCLTWPDGQVQTVPSLAVSQFTKPIPGCQPARDKLEIIYSLPPWAGKETTRALVRITEDDFRNPARINAVVQGAIVIIGETGPAAWRDFHLTPIGMLPGPLIHANALLTPEARTAPLHVSWWEEGLVAAAGATAAGCCFVLYHRWRWRNSKFRHAGLSAWPGNVGAFAAASILAMVAAGGVAWLAHHEFADALKTSMEVLSVVVASVVFASYGGLMSWLDQWCTRLIARATVRLTCYLPIVLGLLVILATFWVYVGAKMLPYGWHTASLVPIFAAGLEALLKAGGRLMDTLEIGVAWFMRVAALIALAVLKPVTLPATAAESLKAAEPAYMPSPREEPGGTLSRSLYAFWRLVTEASLSQSPTSGAGVRVRGAGEVTRLEWLPLVPMDGPKISAGLPGLALAWRGGVTPYLVELAGKVSGNALGSFRSGAPFLWIPAFRMPAEPVVLSIRDAARGRLSATLLLANAPPPMTIPADEAAQAPASAAMALFVDGGPAWRLEALRQLATLAPTNAQAEEALAGIRGTGGTGSPQ